MRRYVAAGGPDETRCEADCLGFHGFFVRDLWGLELLLLTSQKSFLFSLALFFWPLQQSKAHLELANFSHLTSSRL